VASQGDGRGLSAGQADWEARLKQLVSRHLLVLGIGNDIAGDDGVGPYVARRLAESFPGRALDCGTAAENFLGPIERAAPDVVVMVDAARTGAPAGSVHIVGSEDFCETDFSTHGMSPGLFLEMIHELTRARVLACLVERGERDEGKTLSPEVLAAADRLVSVLADLVRREAAEG
jgi:hydrogenase 3 maturation protease